MQIWSNFEGYKECPNITRLIKILPSEQYSDSLKEIEHNIDLFGNHSQNPIYISSGPLRECQSVFFNKRNNVYFKFTKTIDLLKNLKNSLDFDAVISRAYVTILPPSKKIYAHADTDGSYFSKIDRYQFYFTGNNDTIQIINNTQFDVAPGYFYYFDHRQIHEYINNSDEKLILMVFDVEK